MRICHQFYENSMSGANSYVEVFDTHEGAVENMFDSIYQCIAHCEVETMNKIVRFLQSGIEGKLEIDGFNVENRDDSGYFITDKMGEDNYWFEIMDVQGGKMSSHF